MWILNDFIYESYTNEHNMAIRVFQIWRSGVPDPNDDVSFGFGAAAAASHRINEAGCCERRRATAPSEWDGPLRVTGLRRLRRAAASVGGPRRVITVMARCLWRRAAAGDGGLRVTRAVASEAGCGERWTAGCCEWLRPGRMSRAGRCAWRVTRVTVIPRAARAGPEWLLVGPWRHSLGRPGFG